MTAMTELPDFLPVGWSTVSTPPPLTDTFPEPAEPAGPPPGPAMSGPVTTVTSRTGTPVTIHRADYEIEDHLGEYLVHGYAWRCTGCTHTATGYPPIQFAQAMWDGRDHQCGKAS